MIELGETDFTARLIDLTAGATYEEEEAIIPRSNLSDDDNARICLGGIFRWVIGNERHPDGTEKPVSLIVFCDAPAVTESDLRDAEAWAEKMAALLGP